jgi:hypothetical protein
MLSVPSVCIVSIHCFVDWSHICQTLNEMAQWLSLILGIWVAGSNLGAETNYRSPPSFPPHGFLESLKPNTSDWSRLLPIHYLLIFLQ